MVQVDENRVQQFVLLAKGARGRALVDLIAKATAEPGVFGYSELLAVPQIQEIAKSPEHGSHHRMLEMFAYGTWPEYQTSQAAGEALPELNPAQVNKLKQLTVASLALRQKVIPYSELQQALGISSVRELEDYLIAECFYAGLIKGKLDQKQACVQVHDVVGRDVRPEDLPLLEQGVNTWLAAAEGLVASLEERIGEATHLSQAARKQREEQQQAADDARKQVKAELDSRSAAEMMMLDEAGLGGGGGADMDEDRLDRMGGGGFRDVLGGAGGFGASERPDRHRATLASRSKKRIQR